ncbi:hypothetical protein [Streptomonospora wellingtoniae]|uniref:Spo0E family sporulation regulatory protein-aspartic acid phosphatase n=1 Tax=Streptomonospora wellingtoniae TaxID=3075544 RepID=A0ABU2KPY5_9ACTN|nr:hypothetical protein [Streptomonospora sp. DSM 45055]MDT0301340.1 hypothetical protein [Streptomonospora sp. DSM 45055]
MRLERERLAVLRATMHAHELASLMAAARYVVHNAPAGVPEEARLQLTKVLDDYDEQVRRLPPPAAQGPGPERGSPPGPVP